MIPTGCENTGIGQKEGMDYDAFATKTSANFTGSSRSGTDLHKSISGDRDGWWQTFIGPHQQSIGCRLLPRKGHHFGLGDFSAENNVQRRTQL